MEETDIGDPSHPLLVAGADFFGIQELTQEAALAMHQVFLACG